MALASAGRGPAHAADSPLGRRAAGRPHTADSGGTRLRRYDTVRALRRAPRAGRDQSIPRMPTGVDIAPLTRARSAAGGRARAPAARMRRADSALQLAARARHYRSCRGVNGCVLSATRSEVAGAVARKTRAHWKPAHRHRVEG